MRTRSLLMFGASCLVIVTGIAVTTVGAGGMGPTSTDRERSARIALLPRGGEDFRAPLPPLGMVGAPGVVVLGDHEVALSMRVAGVVAEVLVQEGEAVAAGAPLLRLYAESERWAVASAQAELEAARAALTKIEEGPRREERRVYRAQASADRARALHSARSLARTRVLVARGALAREELERAATQARIDRKTAEVSAARRDAALRGPRREDAMLARAEVARAEARLGQAKAAADAAVLVAPQAGKILDVRVSRGEYVHLGEPAVLLGDPSAVRVRLDIDERDVQRVIIGAEAYVQADAFGARRFAGHVVSLGHRLGAKRVHTGDVDERHDTAVLTAVVELDGRPPLIAGLRVTAYIVEREAGEGSTSVEIGPALEP